MKQLFNLCLKLCLALLLLASLTWQGHAANNNFVTNNLYLGLTESGALDDYIIDLGLQGAVGAGGVTVKDLSGEFSLSTFNTVFSGGPPGVVMAVVGGNSTFGHGDVYATQLRTANLGVPALPGSALPVTNVPSATLTAAVGTLGSLMLNTGGLPSAGAAKLDSSLSYTAIAESSSPSQFDSKCGITPYSTITASSNIVMDLWELPASAPTNIYLGYFTLDLSSATPKFTFTPRGAAASGPVAGFSGAPTSGAAPLPVVFTDASTGNITNWVWNLGDGTSVTNTSNASVNHTYTSAGAYTITLTVSGSAGTNALTRTGYIVVSSGSTPVPAFNSVILSGGKFIFSGTNGAASTQFRVLASTNLAMPIAGWIPVYTNNFLGNGGFSYTNSSPTNQSYYFRLVSP